MPKPRTRRPADSRDALLAAATDEFALKGFAGASVDTIAGRAGVNKAMIYYHFKSKERLYLEILRGVFISMGARTGAMETRGTRMVKHDFSPHFSANNMYKDLSQALQLAGEVGSFLPAAAASLEILRAVKNQGKGDLDSCSVMTIIEAMANTVVKTES